MALSTSDFAGDGTRLSRLQDGEAPEEERESKRFALVAQKVELVRGTLDCAAAQVGSSKCSARDSWLIAIFTFGEGYHNVFAKVVSNSTARACRAELVCFLWQTYRRHGMLRKFSPALLDTLELTQDIEGEQSACLRALQTVRAAAGVLHRRPPLAKHA